MAPRLWLVVTEIIFPLIYNTVVRALWLVNVLQALALCSLAKLTTQSFQNHLCSRELAQPWTSGRKSLMSGGRWP
jgi:hypothetical protein